MKSCIHTHPAHLDQRPLRPPKLNNAVLVCSSFGGLRGLRACNGPFRGCSNDNIGGRDRLRRPELDLQKAQTSVDEQFSPVSLIPVRNNQIGLKFIAVSTTPPKNCSPVSTTLPIKFRRCQRHRRIESPANISLSSPKNEK